MGRRKRKLVLGDLCIVIVKKLIKICSIIEIVKKLIKSGDFVWVKLFLIFYFWFVKIEKVDILDDYEEYYVYCKVDIVM